MKKLLYIIIVIFPLSLLAQDSSSYWNKNTRLLPWRMPIVMGKVERVDLDKDGDPDLLKAVINDSIPIVWVDDDDDMKPGDLEGDTDNDCLLIDRNRDGIFAGPMDFSIDWSDEDGDGKADIQLVVNNAGSRLRGYYDWGADFMFIFDDDKDGIMHYIDWNKIMMQAWEHSGHANFYKDYQGNSTFLKMHASSFRINDLRYNWENPFIFYDTDKDGLTEWAIRLVDTPEFRDTANASKNGFQQVDTAYDVKFTKKIDYAALTWDLDNDNAAGNEFDFDMSILFRGKGFSYEDQAHKLKNLKGLAGAEQLFYDNRWRVLDKLYFPDRDTAYGMVFRKGNWQECRLVFDEDDDCNRWERVEFYEPRDLFITGMEKGGLDHNKQADAAGDRGEFDQDNSGKGRLYIGAFDSKIHLYGAEWGAWRIDQQAYSFQGFGGNYERWGRERLQRDPQGFATVRYEDKDKNGFIDAVLYDLDGDKLFEDSVSFHLLGISDKQPLFDPVNKTSASYNTLFLKAANESWMKAGLAMKVAERKGLQTGWYNFYKYPRSIHQRYEYGYWLSFYIYHDLRQLAKLKGDVKLVNSLDKAYYSGKWETLL